MTIPISTNNCLGFEINPSPRPAHAVRKAIRHHQAHNTVLLYDTLAPPFPLLSATFLTELDALAFAHELALSNQDNPVIILTSTGETSAILCSDQRRGARAALAAEALWLHTTPTKTQHTNHHQQLPTLDTQHPTMP